MLDKNITNRVNITAFPSPFNVRQEKTTAPEGLSLADMMRAAGTYTPMAHVFVNDVMILFNEWDNCFPVADDIVAVRVAPAGGGGENNDSNKALRTVLTIVVLIISMYVPQAGIAALGIQGGTTAAMFAGAAIGLIGNLAINALLPPPMTGNKSTEDYTKNYAVSSSNNKTLPYAAVPQPIGKIRHYPAYGAKSYTEILGDDQYLRMLFCFGAGPMEIDDIKIGDTLLSEYTDYEMDIGTAASPPDIYTYDVNEEQESVELTKYQIKYQIYWYEPVIEQGDTGPIEGESVRVYGQIYDNRIDAQNACIGLNGGGMTGIPSYDSVDWTIRTTEANVNEISIDLAASGLCYINDEGKSTEAHIYFKVEYRKHGTDVWINTVVAFDLEYSDYFKIESDYFIFSGSEGRAYRAGLRWRVATGKYDIRIKRTDLWAPKATTHILYSPDGQTRLYDDLYWTTIRSINTEQSPIGDNCNPNMVFVALRIKATEQLNGVIDELNAVVTTHAPVYNGSSWSIQATDNVAWQYAHILTGSSNKKAMAYSRLDADAFKDWADDCTNEGYKIGMVVSARTTVFELLKQVASVGRADVGMSDSLHSIVREIRQTTPTQMFSPRNSWNFSGNKVFIERPHCLNCEFINPEKDYENDTRPVYDDGYDETNATIFETVPLTGVIDSDHAWKLGRYHIAVAKLRPENFSFYADFEHIVCKRGDMVWVANDVILVGLGQGRIKTINIAGSTVTLTLDSKIVMVSGTEYGIRIRCSTGEYISVRVNTVPGETDTLVCTLASGFSALLSVGDLITFGESSREVSEMIVKEIRPEADLIAKISLVDAAPGIHDAIIGDIPAWSSNITYSPNAGSQPPAAPVIDSIVSGESVVVNAAGMPVNGLVINYSFSTSWLTVHPRYVECQYRTDDINGKWKSLPLQNVDDRSIIISPIADGETYQIRIRLVSATGKASDWTYNTGVAVNRVSPMGAIGNIKIVSADESKDIIVTWDRIEDPTFSKYKIVAYLSDNTILRTRYEQSEMFEYLWADNTYDNNGVGMPDIQFAVSWIDVYGNESDPTTTTAGYVGYVSGDLRHTLSIWGKLELSWDDEGSSDPQFVEFEVRASSWTDEWERARVLGTTQDTIWSGNINTTTDKVVYVRAKFNSSHSAEGGSIFWSSKIYSLVLGKLTKPTISVGINQPNIEISWPNSSADRYVVEVDRGSFTTNFRVTDNKFSFYIPAYDVKIRVRAFDTSGYFSEWSLVEEISITGIYHWNEKLAIDFDWTDGRFVNMCYLGSGTVKRPSVLGSTPSIPINDVNDCDLFNLTYNLDSVITSSIKDTPTNWFRYDWFEQKSGWFESAVIDFGDTYDGRFQLSLTTSVTHNSRSISDWEWVGTKYVAPFTVAELMSEEVRVTGTIWVSVNGNVWKEIENGDWITGMRYAKMRFEIAEASPLTDVTITAARLLIDVPDIDETGSVDMDGSGTDYAVTFTKTFEEKPFVFCNAEGAPTANAINVTTTGFTIRLSSATACTVGWFAKGY